MSFLKTIREKLATRHEASCDCGCGKSPTTVAPVRITKDMIVREVADRWPQTVAVFGKYKVDFCCGGAHSIEQTARARGCGDIDALVTDLNRVVSESSQTRVPGVEQG